MGMTQDLTAEVDQIIRTDWKQRAGDRVPEAEEVKLGNDAVTLNATVLYADLAESTKLVGSFRHWFAAEIYKCYLVCACRIIRDRGGVITAFDGDRVMGVFIGDSKNSSAARAALAINHAVVQIINPRIRAYRPNDTNVAALTVRHAVGIDTGDLFIARTGIRGANDLVWVGRPANYAAKLCALRDGDYATYTTADVFSRLEKSVVTAIDGRPMWEQRTWTSENCTVYRSNWNWAL